MQTVARFFAATLLISCISVTANTDHPKVIAHALSYDDVLLVPQKSSVFSRSHVSIGTQLTKNISLHMPIVSSNMDTVTESDMAIAMACYGGIGIIHRFNSIEKQVFEVQRVKRFTNALIEHPLTIEPSKTIEQARTIMESSGITSLIVVNANKKVEGIVTKRDIHFAKNSDIVSELMTPKNKLVTGEVGITIVQAKNKMLKHRIEKLPIIHKNETLAGLITSKDIHRKSQFPFAALDRKGRLLVGAAIGVKEDSLERAAALVTAGVDVLVVDIAHGHSDLAINTVKAVKEAFPDIDIIAGNVATAQGTLDLIKAGANAVKVGIGPGSICTTRITTGSGYPQFSAILESATIAAQYGVPIIADGGIRTSGDITKALGAGASTVMLGSLLAGTKESPGIPFIKKGKKFKVIRGMASFGARLGREVAEKKNTNFNNIGTFVPEGVEAMVPYKGEVGEIIAQLVGGLRSGMSYCGVTTIEGLRKNALFIQITPAAMVESNSHDVVQA